MLLHSIIMVGRGLASDRITVAWQVVFIDHVSTEKMVMDALSHSAVTAEVPDPLRAVFVLLIFRATTRILRREGACT